jgi:acyl-CoA thioester hydrolase
VKKAELRNFNKIATGLSVRFRDVDAMRHVNNAVFFTYFEEGRKVFLEEVFGIVQPEDYPFILAQMSCDYLKPLKLGDSPHLEVWIGEVGQRKFSFIYRIVDGSDEETVYAKGKSVMVLFDYKQNTAVPIPKDFLEKLLPYREDKEA